MRGRGGDEVDDSAECIGPVQSGPGAFENLDGVHGLERDGEIEIVVRGLSIVDAEAVDEDEGLSEAAAAKDYIGLSAACTALFDEGGGIAAKKIEGRLYRQEVRLDGKDFDGAG